MCIKLKRSRVAAITGDEWWLACVSWISPHTHSWLLQMYWFYYVWMPTWNNGMTTVPTVSWFQRNTHFPKLTCFLPTKDLPRHTHKPSVPGPCVQAHRKKQVSLEVHFFVTICNVGFCCRIVSMELLFTMYGYKMHIAINLMFTMTFLLSFIAWKMECKW